MDPTLTDVQDRIRFVVDNLDDEPQPERLDRLSAIVALHTFLHQLAAEPMPAEAMA